MAKKNLPAKTSESIESFHKQVTEEISKLKEVENVSFKTNGKFKFNLSEDGHLDLKTSTDTHSLILAFGALQQSEEAYNKAGIELFGEDPIPPFMWQEESPSDWKHDIKLRVTINYAESKKNELLKIQGELAEHITENQKAKSAIEKAKNFFLKQI